jgi:hypothetical protein
MLKDRLCDAAFELYLWKERKRANELANVLPLKDRSATRSPHSRWFFLFVLWTLKQSEILPTQSRERGQISQLLTTTVYYVSVVKGKLLLLISKMKFY